MPDIEKTAIAQLRKSLEEKVTDLWPQGTVVRWTASDRYTYAAIKTAVGWFTTSRSGNNFVPQQLDYESLVEVLARSETSDIEVATAWESL